MILPRNCVPYTAEYPTMPLLDDARFQPASDQSLLVYLGNEISLGNPPARPEAAPPARITTDPRRAQSPSRLCIVC